MKRRTTIDPIVGEVLTHIDVSGDEIMLTTASGKVIRIHHIDECCETVQIADTKGNWHELIGKVIVEAIEEVDERGEPEPEYAESWTWTTLTFRVNDATVISRWIGESNGYYSETVDIEEITK